MSVNTNPKWHWFFADFPQPVATLPFTVSVSQPALVHRLKTVMRYQSGDSLVLVDATQQQAYQGVVQTIHRGEVTVTLLAPIAARQLDSPKMIAAVSLIKGTRWEWILQKLTELGVAEIIPLAAQRSVVEVKQPETKRSRWQEIVTQAAEQSERVSLPQLYPPMPLPRFAEAMQARPGVLKLVASERAGTPLSQAIVNSSNADEIVFAIGPEGGWVEAELDLLRSAGFQWVHFGDTILRSETAAMYLASILHYARHQNPVIATTG